MPNQNRVGIRRSTGSDTSGHAEVDNQSARYRWRHFRRGRQPQRRRESTDAVSGLWSDKRYGRTRGSRRGRNDIGGHGHGGYTNGREGFHTGIGLTRAWRCSRKVPTWIELPAWLGETWFDPVGLVVSE